MDDDGMGFGFFLRMAGVLIAIGIALFVAALIFFRAAYAWGFFGAFLAVVVVLLGVAWVYDRRQANRYYAE